MNDEEWRKFVDEHVLRDILEDLQERVKDHDIILKGERGKGGLIAEYDRHDDKLTRLYAVIFQDPTGQKGLLRDVDLLMGRRSSREKSSEFKWQFWTAVIVAIISSGSLVLTRWPEIKKLLPQDHPDQISQMIEKAKHPKSKKKIYRYRVVPASAPITETEPKKEPTPAE